MAQVGQAFQPVMTGRIACPAKTDNANAGEKLYDLRLSLRRDNIARQGTSVRIELGEHTGFNSGMGRQHSEAFARSYFWLAKRLLDSANQRTIDRVKIILLTFYPRESIKSIANAAGARR